MKTALLFIDEATQVVLTPENDLETKALALLKKDNTAVKILHGSFYLDRCRGGWHRQYQSDESVVILLEKRNEIDLPNSEDE